MLKYKNNTDIPDELIENALKGFYTVIKIDDIPVAKLVTDEFNDYQKYMQTNIKDDAASIILQYSPTESLTDGLAAISHLPECEGILPEELVGDILTKRVHETMKHVLK